jgi:hypothetical protein
MGALRKRCKAARDCRVVTRNICALAVADGAAAAMPKSRPRFHTTGQNWGKYRRCLSPALAQDVLLAKERVA